MLIRMCSNCEVRTVVPRVSPALYALAQMLPVQVKPHRDDFLCGECYDSFGKIMTEVISGY